MCSLETLVVIPFPTGRGDGVRLPKSKALAVSAAVVTMVGATAFTLHTGSGTDKVQDNGQRKVDRASIGNPSTLTGDVHTNHDEWITFVRTVNPVERQQGTDEEHPFQVSATKTQDIPFQTIRQRTDRLYQGQHRVLTYGVKGLLQIQTSCVYQGHTAIRHTTLRRVVKQPVNEVIEVGTAKRPIVLSGRGDSSIVALKSLTVLATAYVSGGRTATGVPAQPGVIAVDPRVIPLGTKLYIPGIGVVRAEDTGGAIIGDHIDICMATQAQADAWGARTIRIYEIQ